MIKKKLKNMFFSSSLLLKIDKKYIKSIQKNNYLTILNLHKVSLKNSSFYPSLNPKIFEELIRYVTRHFNIITFAQILNYQENNKPLLILSFDDGYYDFWEYAMPIMEKYNIQANLNVIPSYIETQEPLWNIKLYDFLNSSSNSLIKEIEIEGFNYKIIEGNKSKYGMLLGRYLKQMTKEKRNIILEQLKPIFEKNSNVLYTRMLNKQEVLEVAKYYEAMGYETNSFFQEDFLKCKNYFDQELKLPVNIYSFPNGSYRQEQIDFLSQNNIEHILLVNNTYLKLYTKIHNRFIYYADSINEAKVRAVGFYK